jgi:hypothetical protein
MPAHVDLDFARLRPHHGRRDHGFEELLRQLLIASPPGGCHRLEHKGPGADGGVEVLAHMSNGDLIGYQSKYFVDAFGASQVAQIRESFGRALAAYPRMVRYVVALPRNLSGGPGRRSMRQRWDDFVAEAQAEATAQARTVTIELWDESALVARLIPNDPVRAGLRLFFFDELALTRDWFHDRFAASRAELADRYLPDDHVDVEAQELLDVVSRNGRFHERVQAHRVIWPETLKAFHDLVRATAPASEAAHWALVRRAIESGRDQTLTLDFAAPGPIDLSELRNTVETLRGGTDLRAVFDDLVRVATENAESKERRDVLRHLEYSLEGALDALYSTFQTLDRPALARPRLLVVGEAGAGKSHSLAHLTERQIGSGAGAVLFLGQQFAVGDPRAQILSRLGLPGIAFDTFLGALNAVALASGRPSLIVIDALNEAEAPHLWSTSLAGLAADIARFTGLALIVSCRDVYESRCIPANLEITRHEHFGFEGDTAAAAKTYLDRHGIDRPSAPFLDPTFTNPLFLSTCVRRLVAEGHTAFPTGLNGITRLFDFWLDGVEASLSRRGYTRVIPGDGRLRAALRRFADQLALEGRDDLPIDQARELLERDLAKYAPSGPEEELLYRLVDEGVLRREPGTSDEAEAVAFTFQRFSDHFVAEAILRLNDTPAALATALRPGGDFHYVFEGEPWAPTGVQEALMTQAPERFGLELVDLEPGFSDQVKLGRLPWLDSLRWRAPGATSRRTVEIFEHLEAGKAQYDTRYTSLLFQAATAPGHTLNANYLHETLCNAPMAQRDARWAGPFHWALTEDAPAETLLDWAEHARTDLADPERVRLALTVLIWLTLSSTRPLRDRATKAVTAVFLRSPGQIGPAIDRFADVDDGYVRERLFAAALGAVLHLHNEESAVTAAAIATDAAVFARPVVERHAYVRRYARGIVEAAAARGWVPDDMAARAHPPYASEPITAWPGWEDLRPHDPDARSILWSTVGHLPDPGEPPPHLVGDFGRYSMGGTIDDFSAAERGADPPVTYGDERRAFIAKVEVAGGEPAKLLETAREAHEAREALWRNRSLESIRALLVGTGPGKSADEALIEAGADEAFEAFLLSLPPDLAQHPNAQQPFRSHRDDDIPSFSRAVARRWVAARAIGLGWRAELHADIERLTSRYGGRSDHAIERIGKKYQWIAFHELIGALADRHWRLAWRKRPAILDHVEEVRDVDIDPSYSAPKQDDRPGSGFPALGLVEQDIAQPDDVDVAIAWARSPDGHPQPELVVEGRDSQGRRWWLIDHWMRDRDYMEKIQSDRPVATGQWSIDLILLKRSDAQTLHDLLLRRHLNNIDFVDRDDRRGRLFGEHRFDLTAKCGPILNRHAGGVSYGSATSRFSPNRGEYDHSGIPDTSFHVPRPWLGRGLSLRPAGPSRPWFVTPEGVPALIHPGVLGGMPGRPMLNAELLEPLLESEGLVPAWVTWMEKDGGDGRGQHFGRGGRYERETYAGLWWREQGVWKGSSWRVDEGQLNPHLEDLEAEED